MNFMRHIFLFLATACAGCCTIREPERPVTDVTALPKGREARLQLAGFEASFVSYLPSYGQATVVTPGGWYGGWGRYRGCWGVTTVSMTQYVPQVAATSAYRDRATDALERGGCILQTEDPQYRAEIRFDGPFVTSGDGWAALGWSVLTVFTADYGAQGWTAKLKIHDVRSGKLVLERDYAQRYEAVTWGPVLIFAPAASEKTTDNFMKDWCLTALTDRAVAGIFEFLRMRQ